MTASGRLKRLLALLGLLVFSCLGLLPDRPAAARTSVLARVSLKPGMTLSHLAYRYYGDASLWGRIARANGIGNPRTIPAYTRLVIPAVSGTIHRAYRRPRPTLAVERRRPNHRTLALPLSQQPMRPQPRQPVRLPVRLMPRPVSFTSPEPHRVIPAVAKPRVRFLRPVAPLTANPRKGQPMNVAARVEPVRRNPFHVLVPESAPARPPSAPLPAWPPGVSVPAPPPLPMASMPPAPVAIPSRPTAWAESTPLLLRFSGLVVSETEPSTAIIEVKRGEQSDYVSISIGDRLLQNYTLVSVNMKQIELLRRSSNTRLTLRLDQPVTLQP